MLGSWILPKHTRPVPSNVRPSGHSQWKDPLLLTQCPFGQTPGNTSHSLTSAGKWSKQRNKDVTDRKSRCTLTSSIAYSFCNNMDYYLSSADIFHNEATGSPGYQLWKLPQPCSSIKHSRASSLPAALCLQGEGWRFTPQHKEEKWETQSCFLKVLF